MKNILKSASSTKRKNGTLQTNKSWERKIDNLKLSDIQKNSSDDAKIFPNQFDAAKKFVKALMSWYENEDEFTSRNRHLLVSALPQSGKTGFMAAVANILNVIPSLVSYLSIDSMWFITGMNDTGLQKQTAERIELQVIGATDNNVDSGKNDRNKTKNSFFKVYRNQELRNPEKLLVSKGDLKKAIIFIDEAHYGSGETSILHSFFKYHGLDFKNGRELRINDIFIASISATNTSEIFSDLSDSKQHIVLQPSEYYYGPKEFLENNQIINATDSDFKKNRDTGTIPIIEYIKDAYIQMCKFAFEGHIPRFNPETGEQDFSPKGCCFIRVSKKYDNEIKNNEFVKEKFKIIQIDTSSSKKVNYESVFTEFLVMLNTPHQKPVLFLVKGAYRAGITKHPQIKDYTFMIYDRSKNLLSTIQGLMGRMCGVRKNHNIASLTKIYVNKEHVSQYVDWEMSDFDRSQVPAKYEWVSKNSLSNLEITKIKTSTNFLSENDFKMGSESFGTNFQIPLSHSEVRKIYEFYKMSPLDSRISLSEFIRTKDKNFYFDFVAEVYIKPGGVSGFTIDGEQTIPYKERIIKDWIEGDRPGGVKSRGYVHFKHLFGREKFDENLDSNKITIHIVLNDVTKELKVIPRKLVPNYRIANQEKNYQSHKDTTIEHY